MNIFLKKYGDGQAEPREMAQTVLGKILEDWIKSQCTGSSVSI